MNPQPPPQPQPPRAGQPQPPRAGQQQPVPGTPTPHWILPAPPENHPNGHKPSAPAAPPPAASQAAKPRGWWLRNWIGVVALVPLLVVTVAVRWDMIYWYVWKTQPHVPVDTAQAQWVSFSGAQMRLAEFGQAANVLGSNSKPIALPAGVTVWKAVLQFKAPDQKAIYGCEISLEDSQNRLYGTGATELSNVRGQSFLTCTKPDENDPSSEYAITVLFVTRTGVKPVAVQIRWKLEFPRYVRLVVDR